MVREPSVEDTISILRGLSPKYEQHHNIKIKDTALVAAAVLSHRYITDRFLPDKAIDLVDESAARIRMQMESKPQELDDVDRRIMQLEIDRASVARDKDDPASRERLARIDAEMAALKEKADALRARWQAEKGGMDRLTKIKAEIEAATHTLAEVTRAADWTRAAEIQHSVLPRLERERAELEARVNQPTVGGASGAPMVRNEVDEEDIAATVAKWTGIPVSRLLEGEVEKLVKMEARLSQRVVGQDEAIRAVANAVRRGRAGLSDPNRPIGSFEKAHPDVFNVLLQLLDDGRLTDGHGRTVDFRNAVVIMTSNLAGHLFRDFTDPEKVRPLLMQELRNALRPEFLNRIDEIVIFTPLDRTQLSRIVEIQLSYLRRRLAERRMELEISDAAKELLAREGYDPTFGARPLKRTIQRRIQDPLALKILEGEFKDGDIVTVDAEGNELTFR